MTNTDGQSYRGSRRIIWLAIAVVAVIALYTAGWFYIGGKLEDQMAGAMTRLNNNGTRADCGNAEAKGYPFRVGIFCDNVFYEQAEQGLSVSAGAFRSAAQIYQPDVIVGELDGPARLQLAGLAPLQLTWDHANASLHLDKPMPEQISAVGQNVSVKLQEPIGSGDLMRIANAQIHTRTVGDDLDLALRFTDLAISAEAVNGNAIPPLSGLADISITDGVALAVERAVSLRGYSGDIRTVTLDTSGIEVISITGPFSIDENGVLDAKFQVTIHDLRALGTLLAAALPNEADKIQPALGLLASTSRSGEMPSLPLTITKGRPAIGFIGFPPLPALP